MTAPARDDAAERLLDGAQLGAFVWTSPTLVAAIVDEEHRLVAVSPHLEGLIRGSRSGPSLAGEAAGSLVSREQGAALDAALAGAGPAWTEHHFGVVFDEDGLPADYRLLLRRLGDRVVVVGEPDVAGPTAVSHMLLEMNEDLLSEQRRVVSDRDRLDHMSTTDTLTDLGNRRLLEVLLPRMIDASVARSEPLSVVFADIDRFKAVNDAFGHAAGDDVLVFVGALLKGTSRGADIVVRFGGEEFVAVLPSCDLQGAVLWAERARRMHAQASVPCIGAPVTLSFGVAALGPGESAGDVLARADAALYAAKDAGRNCVVASGAQRPGRTGRAR